MFVGIAIANQNKNEGGVESVVVVSDGTCIMRSERSVGKEGKEWKEVLDEILTKIEEYARTRGHKVSRCKCRNKSKTSRVAYFVLVFVCITD